MKKDKQKAIYWYRKVAEQDKCIMQSYAQYELGCIYEQGWGVEKNLTEAVKWYQKANNVDANKALKRLGY